MKARKFFPFVVVAAGLLAYSNSFTGGYFWGDVGSIPMNPTIRQLWPIWQPLSPPRADQIAPGLTVQGRPIINLSLAINYALGGYNVWGYHALNLIVHILAGLTLLGIVRRTLLTPTLRARFGAAADELALATAVLWTVHPLQTESVTYIIQRAESIMGLFYLLTLYCFIRGTESPPIGNGEWEMGNGSWGRRSRLWYGLSVTACALGMGSKESMATAPVMVILYDRAFLSDSFRQAWRRRWPLYLAFIGTWMLLGVVLVSAGNFATTAKNARHAGITSWEYLATEPGVILHYLRLTAWPAPLRLICEWPIARTWTRILPPAIVVVVLLVAVVWAWRKHPAWGFVGAWFFLILTPTSTVVPLTDVLAEHRMYLSLAAVVSMVVIGLYSLAGRHSFAVIAALAIGLGFLTWRRNQDYHVDPHSSLGFALEKAGRNQEAIERFEQALRVTPDDAWLQYNYGVALLDLARPQEAIPHFEQALRVKPDLAAAHNDLGLALARVGRVQEAIGHYEQALRIKPDFAEPYNNLGNALFQAGKIEEAIRHFEQALRIKPDFSEAHNNLGIALDRVGKLPEAIQHYEQALRINPDYAEAHNNLAVALGKAGRTDEAMAHWEEALRIQPDYAEAHCNLAKCLFEKGRVEDAVKHYEQALRIKPDSVEAHYSLGLALARLGNVPAAIEQWQQALRFRPDYAEAHYNLAVVLEQTGKIDDAIKHYEQALRINPHLTRAQDRLASLRAGSARPQPAP